MNVFVAGNRGFVGSAIVRMFGRVPNSEIFVSEDAADYRDTAWAVDAFDDHTIDVLIIAAGRCSGIEANVSKPADHIHTNILVQTNLIHAAMTAGVRKVVVLGSSCAYPRDAEQPIKEEAFLSGPLEETNRPYAVAKIAALVMAEAYEKQYGVKVLRLMPTNMYGPRDNFGPDSHVLPAMMRKMHAAKVSGEDHVTFMGSGSPRREFMYVDDFAECVAHLVRTTDYSGLLNVGTGEDISLRDAASIMARVVGYEGDVSFCYRGPDGVTAKRLDVTRVNDLGWKASTKLVEGLKKTHAWYQANEAKP